MANRFWVGGTATWDATAGTKWSATSGGAGGASVPTAADDVFFSSLSTGVCTIPAATTVNCRSINCTGFTGTLAFAAGTSTLNVGDASGGSATFASGMTLTANGTIAFRATTASTVYTLTSAGKTLPALDCEMGTTTTIQFADAITCSSIFQGTGTIDMNGKTVTAVGFNSSGAGVRGLILGATTLTLTNNSQAWDVSVATNFTLSAGTSTIILTGATGQFWHGQTANAVAAFNNLQFTGSGVMILQAGASVTFANLTRTGTAAQGDALAISTSITVTGTFTVTGNSSVNRVLLQTTVAGLAKTITAAATSFSRVDFQDITAAGTGNWDVTAITDGAGNIGNNTGITFAAAKTRYAVVGGTSFASTAMWSTVSGGAGGASLPLAHDTVILNASSGAGTFTANLLRVGTIDCTGFAGTLAFTTSTVVFYGSVTWAAGMTLTGTQTVFLACYGSATFTSNGKQTTTPINSVGPGTLTLGDALSCTSSFSINPSTGGPSTFNANGFNVTTTQFTTSNSPVINMGSGTWSLTSTAAVSVWNMINTPVINAGTSTIAITTVSTNTRTFAGKARTYNVLTYTVANSPGMLAITGANTFTTLNVSPGRQLNLPASTTTTVTNWNVNGQANGYLYLPGVSGSYASTPDSAALSITGDIDLRARVAMDDWTSVAGSPVFVSKHTTNQFSYRLFLNSSGRLAIGWSANGTANVATPGSTVAPTVTNGQPIWLRATLDVDNGAAGNTVTFYTANGALANPASGDWVQLGAIVTTAGVTSIFDGTALLEIGASTSGTLQFWAGKVYRAQVLSGIGGTVAFDANFTTKLLGANTFAESSVNAATVTINGANTQAGDGRVAVTSSTAGTAATVSVATGPVLSDYLVLKDSTATGGASFYAGGHSVSTSNNTGWLFSTGTVTGKATGADVARPVTHSRARTTGRATDVNTAASVGRTKAAAVGRATGINTASAVTHTKTYAFGRALGLDVARAVGHMKLLSIGRAVDLAVARSITPVKLRLFAKALEVNTSKTFGLAKHRQLSRSTEATQARAMGRVKVRGLNRTTSLSSAQLIGHTRSAHMGKSSEVAVASAVIRRRSRSIGRAASTNTARHLNRTKTCVLHRATALDTATAASHSRSATLQRTTEQSSANHVHRELVRTIGRCSTSDIARRVAARKRQDLRLLVHDPVDRLSVGTPAEVLTYADPAVRLSVEAGPDRLAITEPQS